MPNYYHHEDYVSEKDMRGWNKDDKAEQREINWDIRLEYYAERKNIKQVVKMLEEWIGRYELPYGGVPTMPMMNYARIVIRHFHTNLKSLGVKINRMLEEYEGLKGRFNWTD